MRADGTGTAASGRAEGDLVRLARSERERAGEVEPDGDRAVGEHHDVGDPCAAQVIGPAFGSIGPDHDEAEVARGNHEPAVDRLGQVQASHDWVDAVRHFVPHSEKLYSWWSYRARDWRASNRGRRLDHVWVTPALAKNLAAASVFADARDWPKASDHAPVVVDIDI